MIPVYIFIWILIHLLRSGWVLCEKNWLCQSHTFQVFPPYWRFGRLKFVGPVEENVTNFVSRTNCDKNWHTVVETLYFFMIYMLQRDQVEKKEKVVTKRVQIFDGHIHLASFPFRLSRSSRVLS